MEREEMIDEINRMIGFKRINTNINISPLNVDAIADNNDNIIESSEKVIDNSSMNIAFNVPTINTGKKIREMLGI